MVSDVSLGFKETKMTKLQDQFQMITDISNIFHIFRKQYLDLKRVQINCILQFIGANDPSELCLICNKSFKILIAEEDMADFKDLQIIEKDSINDKICIICILKIHSKLPKFCLDYNLSYQKLDDQKYLESLCSFKENTIFKSKVYKIDQILQEMEKLDQGLPADQNEEDKFMIQILKSYKNHLKRLKLKKLIKSQIKYKIDAIEEQLEINQTNHRNALLQGNLEEGESFQEVYFNLYELKLELEEKHYKYDKS